MHASVLIDNLSRNGLICEWGLSIYIEYRNKKILLDGGTTGAFVENAAQMGVKLEEVDCAVLSHAHYDHANGLDRFFEINSSAKLHIRSGAKENCYGVKEEVPHYNGIRTGFLKEHAGRIEYARGTEQIMPGAWLLPHSSEGLEKIAARSGLFVRREERLVPDGFRHEQSLVLEGEEGLVIFNSCSHAGPDNIVREVQRAFPGRKICAYIGGLHLYKLSDDEVRALASRMRDCGILRVITGHCTGDRAYEILREELGEGVEQMYTGMEIGI